MAWCPLQGDSTEPPSVFLHTDHFAITYHPYSVMISSWNLPKHQALDPSYAKDLHAEGAVIPVSVLTRAIHSWLENTFDQTWIAGEISNFTQAASGHWYFVLKDASAQIRCAMFRSRTVNAEKIPQNGDHVEVRATATLYEPRGDLQLTVEHIRYAGLGRLYEAFLQLKRKLEAAGLFREERKRPLPPYPHTIGIITSLQAAALRDILTTLARRSPHIRVILYPAPVQGAQAAAQLVKQITCAGQRAEVDALLLCRGGGSIEDLWAFNDEALAYAIAACPLPIVTGIGHETDFTIADFAADARAPTPTGAAQYAAPERLTLSNTLNALHQQLTKTCMRLIDQQLQRVDHLAQRLMRPSQQLAHKYQHLEHLTNRLTQAFTHTVRTAQSHLAKWQIRLRANRPNYMHARALFEPLSRQLSLKIAHTLKIQHAIVHHRATRLELLNPQRTLERGYAALIDPQTQQAIRSINEIVPGQRIQVHVAQGQAQISVSEVFP